MFLFKSTASIIGRILAPFGLFPCIGRDCGHNSAFQIMIYMKELLMAQEEQVLVIETKILEQLGLFQGLAFDVERYLREIFVLGVPRFMPRPQAEQDPAYKQIIPYVIMAHQGKYFSYVRGKRAGETRLVAKRSIGIGGHINPVDADNSSLFAYLYDNYLSAVQREVAEEVTVETSYTDSVVALLNDDSNEVGKVHLGIVHFWNLVAPKVDKKEQMITQMSFMTQAELENVRDSLETWSQKCLDGLAEMEKHTGSKSGLDNIKK
jgi:predicted NUDIX family phosphoesterase